MSNIEVINESVCVANSDTNSDTLADTMSDTNVIELVEKNTAEVVKALEDVKETVKEAAEDVKEVVDDAKEAVDDVKESVEDITHTINDTLDPKLTEEQQTILALFYEDAKAAVEDIILSPLPALVKLTKMIGALMKLFEKVKLHGKTISGSNKKAVVMAIVKRLLKDLVPDRDLLFELLAIYNSNAEYLLETLADVSRSLNVVTEVLESGCCASILSLLNKK